MSMPAKSPGRQEGREETQAYRVVEGFVEAFVAMLRWESGTERRGEMRRASRDRGWTHDSGSWTIRPLARPEWA